MLHDKKACACHNKACGKSFDTEKDKHFACSLCASALYCSESCQAIDWVHHSSDECPNVVRVNKAGVCLAVPYHYEDLLESTADIPKDHPIFQSYMTLQHSPTQKVQATHVPALVEGTATARKVAYVNGADPGDLSGRYALEITMEEGDASYGQTYRVEGYIPGDMIYRGNKRNPKAADLARKFSSRTFGKNTTSYVFWPGMDAVMEKKIRFPRTSGLSITVKLYVRPDHSSIEHLVTSVSTVVTLRNKGGYAPGRWSRMLRSVFERQLKLKTAGQKNVPVDNLYVYRGDDPQGNIVILTFLLPVGGATPQLVDVEFVTPATLVDDAIKTVQDNLATADGLRDIPGLDAYYNDSFACEPRRMDDVVGLAMALDRHMAIKDYAANDHMQLVASAVKAYARELEENNGVPPAIIGQDTRVAISEAVNTLHKAALAK